MPIVVTPDDEWLEYGDDQKSKRALTTVMFFFTLAETSNSGRLPLVNGSAQ